MAMFEVAISDLRASLSLARPPEDLDGVLSPSSLFIRALKRETSCSRANRIRLAGEEEGARKDSLCPLLSPVVRVPPRRGDLVVGDSERKGAWHSAAVRRRAG
jgi:hypothetical protein